MLEILIKSLLLFHDIMLLITSLNNTLMILLYCE